MSPYRTAPEEAPRERGVESLAPDRGQRVTMLFVALVSAVRLALAVVGGEGWSRTTIACVALVLLGARGALRRPRAHVVTIVRTERSMDRSRP